MDCKKQRHLGISLNFYQKDASMLRFSSFSLCPVEINYKLYIYLHINYENMLWNIFRIKYNRKRWQFMSLDTKSNGISNYDYLPKISLKIYLLLLL